MFEGKTINLIKPIGGAVAGQQKTYELWTNGAIVYITNPENVEAIDEVLRAARSMNVEENSYLQFMIDEEGILN